MPVAPEWSGCMTETAPRQARVELMSDLALIGPAVEKILAAATPHLPDGADGREVSDCMSLALTEVLTNISRHGYARRGRGPVVIDSDVTRAALIVCVADRGRPPPLALVRSARMPDPLSMPESGWGWALIHRLSDRVGYERRDGWNHLTLERRFWRYYDADHAWAGRR